MESSIWNQEYTVRNPESKTVLDSGIQEIFTCGTDPESRKYLFVDCGILSLRMPNTNQGIRNLTTDWNLESSALNPGFKGWNPESKTVLDSLSRGDVSTLIEF